MVDGLHELVDSVVLVTSDCTEDEEEREGEKEVVVG